LRSLRNLKSRVAGDALVLASHHRPFFGLHERLGELAEHHAQRCGAIYEAARTPKTAAELLPVLFHRPLDPHEMSFAFSEVLAHMNHMLREGMLAWAEPQNGVERVIAASPGDDNATLTLLSTAAADTACLEPRHGSCPERLKDAAPKLPALACLVRPRSCLCGWRFRLRTGDKRWLLRNAAAATIR
jgi:hypothetical protein